jgi:hypothetical protein
MRSSSGEGFASAHSSFSAFAALALKGTLPMHAHGKSAMTTAAIRDLFIILLSVV